MISVAKCSDFGSNFCPCILAETGKCPVCNVVRGGDFCDCKSDSGFCVYQELQRNHGKARPTRQTIQCEVTTVIRFPGVVFLRFKVPYEMELDLMRPGSFVFLRNDENPLFDFPVSIQYDENAIGTLGVNIILNGPKSNRFKDIQEGDFISVKGPYFNGLAGIDNIYSAIGGKCLVIAKGIGLLPSMSVVCRLKSQSNDVKICVDQGEFPKELIDFHLNLFELEADECKIVTSEGLTEDVKIEIVRFLDDGGRYIHIGASDYVITLITDYLRSIGRTDVKLSSCNNAKMCCGDGICGACTENVPGRGAVHYCKEHIEVWNIDVKNASKYRKK